MPEAEHVDVRLCGFDPGAHESPVDALHRLFGMDPPAAARLVHSLPRVVKQGVELEYARRIRATLESFGGRVELLPMPIRPAAAVFVGSASSRPAPQGDVLPDARHSALPPARYSDAPGAGAVPELHGQTAGGEAGEPPTPRAVSAGAATQRLSQAPDQRRQSARTVVGDAAALAVPRAGAAMRGPAAGQARGATARLDADLIWGAGAPGHPAGPGTEQKREPATPTVQAHTSSTPAPHARPQAAPAPAARAELDDGALALPSGAPHVPLELEHDAAVRTSPRPSAPPPVEMRTSRPPGEMQRAFGKLGTPGLELTSSPLEFLAEGGQQGALDPSEGALELGLAADDGREDDPLALPPPGQAPTRADSHRPASARPPSMRPGPVAGAGAGNPVPPPHRRAAPQPTPTPPRPHALALAYGVLGGLGLLMGLVHLIFAR